MIQEFSEQELIRRESLAKLKELGIEPYPAAQYPVNANAAQIAAEFDPEKGNFQDVCIAGRIMSRRIMGAASFGELQDASGRIQIYVKRDEICPGEDKTMYNTVWKKLLDIGDIIGIKGFAFYTQTHPIEQVAPRASYRKGAGRTGIRRIHRSGDEISPEICGPRRESVSKGRVHKEGEDYRHYARIL